MDFRIEEFRPSNVILFKDKIDVFVVVGKNCSCLEDYGNGAYDEYMNPLPLTKEILRDNLGFDISDMGDFWQCQKEDFVLIQIKLQFGNMPYMFVLKSSIKESVNFYYVHHLQNTYLDLKGELLVWKQ